MQTAKSFRADLDETVQLHFAPVTAIVREFRRALSRQTATGAADIDERTRRLREREAEFLKTMRAIERTIAERRKDLERGAS